MRINKTNNRISDWIDSLIAKGKISFSLVSVRKEFSNVSKEAIKLSLNRL